MHDHFSVYATVNGRAVSRAHRTLKTSQARSAWRPADVAVNGRCEAVSRG